MAQGYAKKDFADPGWQDFTPSWTALTVGNGTETARYMQIGTTVFIHYELLFGSTTAISGNAFFVLPVEPSNGYSDGTVHNFGTVRYTDASASDFNGSTILGSGDQVIMKVWQVSGSQIVSVNLSSTIPFTWDTGDAVGFHFMYEAATSALIGMGLNNDHGALSGLTDDDHTNYAWIVTQRSEPSDSGDLAAGVSETELGSLTLVIPTTWNTYDLEVYHKADITDRGGGSTTTGDRFNFRVRFTNTSGAQIGPTLQAETQNNNALDNQSYLNMVFIEGQTTTGNVEIICSVSESASGWTFDVRRQTFIVKAFRVT